MLLATGLSVLSCNDAALNNSEQDTTQKADSIQAHHDSTNVGVATRPPEGVFQATLPCNDCKGLQHTIAFHNDLSYQLEEMHMGKNTTTQTRGHWKPANGIISLYDQQKIAAQYQWKGDTLVLMNANRQIPLQQRSLASGLDVWKKKSAAGIDFFGVGNEPFWNVEVDENKQIQFHLSDWPAPRKFASVQPVISADSIVYLTKNDSASLRITIYNRFCSDGMSDNIYTSEVKVLFNKQVYRGCGQVFADYFSAKR
jgi:uncharacterized membrane protein